ncbi:MAG TPA: M3 family metallopeptidase [Vicinamibacterales bacterium]|nr:M3 family metallopeptidase [Vicinamibacterales bacterium]
MPAVCLIVAGLAALAQAQAPEAPAASAAAPAFSSSVADAASLRAFVEARLARARALLEQLVSPTGPRTAATTLEPYDTLSGELFTAGAVARVMAALHPDAAVRQAGDALNRAVSALAAEIQLRPDVYEALAAIDRTALDEATRYYLERELRDFRLAGVDRPAAVRERLQALRDELTQRMDEFARNIRQGSRQVAASPSELAGLPPDFIARHTPDPSGIVTLTTDDIDARPVLTYARSEELRRRMLIAVYNVAAPANLAVLERILQIRGEIASMLGYQSWAAYDTATRMAGDVATVSAFIEQVVEAARPKAAREFAELVARKHRDVPGAPFHLWDRQYYGELVRRASYDFDSQSVRPYFPFERVLAGVLEVTGRVFDLAYEADRAVPVWHPSVRVYLVRDRDPQGRVIGRVYLDLHRRPNKAASGASVTLVGNRTSDGGIPEAVLAASLPGGGAGDPGLMTHEEVRTLFHEFGHVVHRLVGAHQRWQRLGSTAMERDFTEAPSQMLEEWTWDPRVLATFAKHHETGEPIPEVLVRQMRRAGEFGKALDVVGQMVLARVSLAYHDRDPKQVDTSALWREIHDRYSPMPYVQGARREASFPHIGQAGYASTYYAYMWSLVIAKDLFGAFGPSDLLSPAVGRRYREALFAPGSSKPAARLVADFLGRPFSFDAWRRWLHEEGR